MAFLNKLPDLISHIRETTKTALKNLLREDKTLKVDQATFDPIKVRDQDVLSSDRFNYEQYSLFLLLRSIYAQATEIEATRLRHENILKESFTKSRAALLKTINDLRIFTFLQQFPEYDDVKFIDFYATRNLSDRAPLANIDTSSRYMRLATVSQIDAQVDRPTLDPAITITHLGANRSEGMIQDFSPANIIDGNTDTYWADLLIADNPIVQDYIDSRGKSRKLYGLATEVIVTLSKSSYINNIRILPFGEFPIGIIDIAYKESKNDPQWKPIPGFVESEPNLDWLEVSFFPVQANLIRITLYQKNYVRGIYHLPASMVHTTNLLEHSIVDSYKDRIGVSAISDDRVAQVAIFPELLGLLESLDEFDKEVLKSDMPEEKIRELTLTQQTLRSISKVLARPNLAAANDILEIIGVNIPEEKEKLLEIKTIEYLVGIRELSISHVTYAPVSYYSSPQFSTSKTPIEVSIHVDEKHPTMKDKNGEFRLTGIDYDLDFGEGLRLPIHPQNLHKAQDEFVYVDRYTHIGYTRFKPENTSVVVRGNGILLKSSEYTFEISNNLGKLTILNNYSPYVIYTITYSPHYDSTKIELPSIINSSPIRVPESFDGTDQTNRIKTKYIPYIAWGIINDDTNFLKRDDEGIWEYIGSSSIAVDGQTYSSESPLYEPIEIFVNHIKATNITDYDNNTQPLFTQVDPAAKLYQYFHIGNYFYFNAPIKDKQITVQYNWLIQYVQLIATLRTYKQAGVDVTPQLNSYRIQVRTSPL